MRQRFAQTMREARFVVCDFDGKAASPSVLELLPECAAIPPPS